MGRIITPRSTDAGPPLASDQPSQNSENTGAAADSTTSNTSNTTTRPTQTFLPANVSDWTELFNFEPASTETEAARPTPQGMTIIQTDMSREGEFTISSSRVVPRTHDPIDILMSEDEEDEMEQARARGATTDRMEARPLQTAGIEAITFVPSPRQRPSQDRFGGGDARPSAATAQRIIERLASARPTTTAASVRIQTPTRSILLSPINNSTLSTATPHQVIHSIYIASRPESLSFWTPPVRNAEDRARSFEVVREAQGRYTGEQAEGWLMEEIKRGLEDGGLGYLVRHHGSRRVGSDTDTIGAARGAGQDQGHFTQEDGEGEMADVPAEGSVMIIGPVPSITPAPTSTTAPSATSAHRPQAPGSLADMGITTRAPNTISSRRSWLNPTATTEPASSLSPSSPLWLTPRSDVPQNMLSFYDVLVADRDDRVERAAAAGDLTGTRGERARARTTTTRARTEQRPRTESEQVIDQAIEDERERRFEENRQALNESNRQRAREALRRAMDGAGMVIGTGPEDARISEEMVTEFVRLEERVLGGGGLRDRMPDEDDEVSELWEAEWRTGDAAIRAREGGAPGRLMDMLERVTEAEEPQDDDNPHEPWAPPTNRSRPRPQSHDFDSESRRLRRRTERMLEMDLQHEEAEAELQDEEDEAAARIEASRQAGADSTPNGLAASSSGLNIASADSLGRIAAYPRLSAAQIRGEQDAPAVAGIGRTDPAVTTVNRGNRPPLAFGTTRRYFEEPENMALDFPYIAPELLRSAVAAGGIVAPTTSRNVTTSPLSLARRAAVRRRRPLDPAAAPFVPWTGERTVERVTANANANAAARARSQQARRYFAERNSNDDRTRTRAMRSLADRQRSDKFLTRREWRDWVIERPMSNSSIISRDGVVTEGGNRRVLKYAESRDAVPFVPFERRASRATAESESRHAQFSALFGHSRTPSPELNFFGDGGNQDALRYYPTGSNVINSATGHLSAVDLSDSEEDDGDDVVNFSLPLGDPYAERRRGAGLSETHDMFRAFLSDSNGTYPSISSPLRPRSRQPVASGTVGMTYEDIVDELRRAEGDEEESDPNMMII